MKKKILLGLFLITVLFVTGCGDTKMLTCRRTATISEEMKMELIYEVTYKGEYVQLVESTEKIISSNEDYLESYKEIVENTYSPYKDVEYYDYDVTVKGDTLTSKVTVNYEKIDTDELIEIDSANATFIKNGKVKLDDIKTLYENLGTICE